MPGNKFNRELVIMEVSAHSSGHYTEEIFYFCKTVSNNFPAVQIYTPYGFRENLIFPENCIVHEILGRENLKKNISFLSQLSFYYNAFRDIRKRKKENIIHIWGYKSIFSLLAGSPFKKTSPIFFNIWRVNRERVSVFNKIKLLGELQVFLSDLLIKKLSHFLIVHSDQDKNSLVAKGFNHNKIRVLQTGIPGDSYSNLSKQEIRKRLSLDPSIFILLYFGTIREEKCLKEVLNLIPSLTGEYYIFIVGDNKSGSDIQNLSSDYIIKNIGYIPSDKKPDYFIASDAVLVCHNKEFQGLSGVMLDAIEYEVPIITKANSNTGMIVEKYGAGCCIVNLENKEIIEAAGYVRQNYSAIKKNLEILKKDYSNSTIHPQYLELYSEALK